jgi:hypothetical protein
MTYYIIDDDYVKNERIKFDQNSSLESQTAYYDNDLDPKDAPAIKFRINTEVDRDFTSNQGFIVICEKFRDILDKLAGDKIAYKYYECDIRWKVGSKVSPKKYFLLGLPELDFFDYEKSVYRGDKESKRVYEINRMVILEPVLNDIPMVRFEKLISVIVISEAMKEALEASGTKGLKFTPTEKWDYLY